MTASERITVLLKKRWTVPCKFCDRPVTIMAQPTGDLVKFDADPTPIGDPYPCGPEDPRICRDVAIDQLHAPRCPGIEHTLFDGLEKETH